MLLAPVCEAAKSLGHTWWPSPQWWLSLTAGDQGAWISGIGALFAAGAAVWISLREQSKRRKESHTVQRVTARFITTDLQNLGTTLVTMHQLYTELAEVTEKSEIQKSSKPYEIRNEAGRVREAIDHLDFARISQLKSSVAESLAGGVGALKFICDVAVQTMELVDANLIDNLPRHCSGAAQNIMIPIYGLLSFFVWHGVEFPEERDQCSEPMVEMLRSRT